MQVTHVADNVTHAVIGKGQARDFGISNSAEFFNILSNTLYSDKIMAVVREVLCNAWDIHIQTGRTDKPVEVSLVDDKLTIRDFGTGISDDDIHPIYAVYGNSTKKLDGTQTGGFGLGSKAPFAYVDHFEVTSWHAGRKTIYAVSKSSAEVAGKPSIMPLVSVACGEETGLMVSMAVKYQDESRFKSVIEMIARFGEMNVVYTDRRVEKKALTTIPFSRAKHGFLMTKDTNGVSGDDNHRIFIRYGNVVYPVPDHEKFKSEYARINKLIQKVGNSSGYYHGGTKWKIIFQAKPNTISVTPSRESLSMTDHTADSLLAVFKTFLALTENQLFDACLQIERECIETVFQTGRIVDLLNSDNKVPTLFDKDGGYQPHRAIVQEPTLITTLDQMGRGLMSKTYPDFPNFRKRDVNMRLDIIEKFGLGGPKNRGKIQSFRREYEKSGNAVGQTWFQQTLVVPLVKRLNEVPELSGSKLLVYGDHTDHSTGKNGRRLNSYEGKKFIEATKLSRRNLEGYMPFLRNIAVISFNRIDVEERLPKFPIFKDQLGDTQDFFVYVVSRADKKIDIVRKFFADQGMTVVDLTVRQDWEPQHVMQPVPKAKLPVKPRKKGLPKLSGLLTKDSRGNPTLDHKRLLLDVHQGGMLDDLERTETPQYVVKINPRAQSMGDMIYGLDRDSERAVAQLYGDLGGVVVNDNQAARFVNELKIPRLEEWFFEKLKEEITTNPRIQLGLQFTWDKLTSSVMVSSEHNKRELLRTIVGNPELAIEFNILNEMTKEDRKVLEIIESIQRRHYHRHTRQMVEITKHMADVVVMPEIQALADTIARSKLVGLLNVDHFSEIFGDTPTEHQKKQRSGALNILLYALS